MSRSRVSLAIGVITLAAILAGSALAQSNDAVAREVIAVAKAEWEALNNNDVSKGTENWAAQIFELS